MLYEKYLNVIDENKDIFCEVSDTLWDNPETPFGEYQAVELLTKKLEENGFCVTYNLCGIPTAFKATYGEGGPSLGVLAEYDGLEGMSQEACAIEKKSIPGKNKAHGCGHNLFAGGSLAAVFAVKAYIEKTGKGQITLFGCPAEEGGGGKVFMARDGAFEGIDAIVSWHPEKMYMVRTRPALANVKVEYAFEGIAAHAGAAHRGRSALDAVELMNVGANFLREHMEVTSRIHYAILDAGGSAPNMVQSHAVVSYMIRAVDAEAVRALHERVDRIAQGAAMMTDTTVSSKVVSAYANLITIPTLQATANEAMHDIPLPVPTEEEIAFGRALQKTMPALTKEEAQKPTFAMEVLDPAPPVAHGGSTDTADVSWNCPTVQMHIGNWAIGTPGHSWQAVSQCRGSYAKKAMLYAGKAVAGTLIRLFENPALIEKAKAEHKEKIGDGYRCGLPANLKPEMQPRK